MICILKNHFIKDETPPCVQHPLGGGLPCVAFQDTSVGHLKFVSCDDPACKTVGEPVTIDGTGDELGTYISMRVGPSKPFPPSPSTRILGRSTARFSLFLIINRVPHGFTPRF